MPTKCLVLLTREPSGVGAYRRLDVWAARSDATLQLAEQIPPRFSLSPGIEHRSQTLAMLPQGGEEAPVRLGAVQ